MEEIRDDCYEANLQSRCSWKNLKFNSKRFCFLVVINYIIDIKLNFLPKNCSNIQQTFIRIAIGI